MRPLVLRYAERLQLENRPGWYDEDREVLVVDVGGSRVPLVRAGQTVLDETATKVRADPADPSRPRRGVGAAAALDETETRVRADRPDPEEPPRRRKPSVTGLPPEGLRVALTETKTSVRADPSDPARPRRAVR